jgi:hypothetical protein
LIWLYRYCTVRGCVADINRGFNFRMASLDRIVFVRRQSPDWGAMTRDYEAGLFIDPSRYKPPPGVPGFPDDITACIRTWNKTFRPHFFRCRKTLKELSEHCVRQIRHSIFIAEDRLGDLPALVANARFLLFFFDDDDWFSPDTFERLSVLDFSACGIAVFPLVRFGDDIITFVRREETAQVVVGARKDFGYRFQTNNYGLTSRIALSDHLPKLRDHMLGSGYADQINLPDTYFDVLISATNKTPCAASSIGRLPSDPAAYRASIRRYVKNLRALRLPREVSWMAEPLDETIKLFIAI